MSDKISKGKYGEQLAAEFLSENGYEIIERNYRYKHAEIDIIARQGEALIFVEVKLRSSQTFGVPEEFDTCRMTPVRMPLIAFGSTTPRMVCQRVAPTFQQASRNDRGTAASASRVLAMITGSVITASVSDAARIDCPSPAASTNAPRPKSAWTILGTPARLMTATWMSRVNQVSRAYSLR